MNCDFKIELYLEAIITLFITIRNFSKICLDTRLSNIGTCEKAVKKVIYHSLYYPGLERIMIYMRKLPEKTNAIYTCYIIFKMYSIVP